MSPVAHTFATCAHQRAGKGLEGLLKRSDLIKLDVDCEEIIRTMICYHPYAHHIRQGYFKLNMQKKSLF